MQTPIQLRVKKAGWARAALMTALLCTSLPLTTACNPFSKVADAITPACQSNSTATVTFQNNSTTGTTYVVVWDGVTKATLAPGQGSSTFTESATAHVLSFKRTNGTLACTTSFPSLVQCNSYTYSCSA